MADYTRDQLMKALRAAHVAGDEDAARAIAGRIQSLPNAAQPDATKPEIPLFSLTGKDKAGEWLQTAIRSGTYNLAQPAAAMLTGTDLATQRAQAQAERADLGTLGATSADVAGYLANPLNRIGGSSIPALMARGAAAQGLSAAAQGENPVAPTIAGALAGGGVGALGKLVRPGLLPHILHQVKDPVLTGAGGAIGGTPGAMIGSAIAKTIPAPGPISPVSSVPPWLLSWLNAATQGALSGVQ